MKLDSGSGEDEYSFVMIKPDTVQRGLEKEVLKYIDHANLEVRASQTRKITSELVEEHYSHVPDEVREDLHQYFDDEEVVVAILDGNNPNKRTREIVGDDFRPEENSMLTIRGSAVNDPTSNFYDKELIPNYDSRIAESWDLPLYNLVHASESYEDAKEEANRFMRRGEDGEYIDNDIL